MQLAQQLLIPHSCGLCCFLYFFESLLLPTRIIVLFCTSLGGFLGCLLLLFALFTFRPVCIIIGSCVGPWIHSFRHFRLALPFLFLFCVFRRAGFSSGLCQRSRDCCS